VTAAIEGRDDAASPAYVGFTVSGGS